MKLAVAHSSPSRRAPLLRHPASLLTTGNPTMATHVKVLGWLYIIGNGLMLLFAVLGGGLAAVGGLLSGDADAAAAGGIMGILAVVFALFAIPGMLIGWGLLNYKNWARILGIVFGVLNLINIPIGTAIGIYSLWVLFNDQVAASFRQGRLAY